MFEINRRGNLAWLLMMTLAAVLFLQAGSTGTLAFISILALLFIIFIANQGRNLSVDDAISRLGIQRFPTTPSARNAKLQASHRHDFDDYYGLQDVGLIVDEPRSDGLRLHRARTVSMDQEAIRPYLVVNAPRHGHPAQTLIRFEINDSAGQLQFVYEMEYYMRPGENAILPDYRLPLRNNERLERMGKWDLQVWVNGGLLAMHTFTVSPSIEERRRQLGVDGEASQRIEAEYDPVPLSLEELLSQQSGR